MRVVMPPIQPASRHAQLSKIWTPWCPRARLDRPPPSGPACSARGPGKSGRDAMRCVNAPATSF